MPQIRRFPLVRRLAAACALALMALVPLQSAEGSSHREAPAITETPKVDNTDFYMFRSYEPGREDYVTLVACVTPLQAPYGGPNYFTMDPTALYEIHIDNDGDAQEDITFQIRAQIEVKDIQIPVGPAGSEVMVSIPLVNAGPFDASSQATLNVVETYSVTMVQGDRRTGTKTALTRTGGDATFTKPHDNIGNKSIPDYASYANAQIHGLEIPGVAPGSRIFVGQRKDPFVIKLGKVFDLVNTNPVGAPDAEGDDLADANVTAICIEVPISFLTAGSANIGAWSSTSKRQAKVRDPKPTEANKSGVEGGAWTQMSRLGMPLVNEVVIGLKDKDRFNKSHPKDDAQFLTYVTNPTLPELLEILFPTAFTAPDVFPRTDLVQAFLTGVPGLNDTATPSEMLRLNTAIPPVIKGAQDRLGVLGSDLAGFPNGRRPGDDIVDISLRVVAGVLLGPADAPSGGLPLTDGALVDDSFFDGAFPYLRTPLPGSTN